MKIYRRLITCSAAVLMSVSIAGCGYLAVQSAPPKRASAQRSDAAIRTDALFWNTLHTGDYDNIGTTLDALQQAYLDDPSDAVTAARIGWMHIWRLSERSRLDNLRATITDDAVLARRYFQETVALNPHEARYLGFLAGSTLAEGSIHKDERLKRRGYYLLLDSIDAWPEFNLFTGGYVMSAQPSDSARFKEALEWQWRTIDICIGERLNRTNPDFARYLGQVKKEGKKSVCWNSWIAPHNVEGFFLNMGDMLVKAGSWQIAQKIYANAKLPASYGQWPFRDVLEQRIANAQSNVTVFNAPLDGKDRVHGRIMFESSFACMGCHQQL